MKSFSEQTEALSKTNEELQRFAYALAHDLNTPFPTLRRCDALLGQEFLRLTIDRL